MRASYLKSFFSEKDYAKICSLFGIGELEEIFHYDTVWYEWDKVFVQTDWGKFVISAYETSGTARPKWRDLILQEIVLLSSLDGLPVPQYVSVDGEFVLAYKGKNITVYHYIEWANPEVLNASMVSHIGQFLGRFHTMGADFQDPLIGRRRFYDLGDDVLRTMDVYAREQSNPLLRGHFERVRTGVIENRLPAGLAVWPIHVDLKPVNILFTGETLSGVLDFWLFYRDALLIDIGKAIMWNCVQDKKVNSELMSHFLEGYERERILPDTERALLKQAILFAIYSHIYVDYYHVPLEIVPESYTVSLVEDFLPVADGLEI